MKTLSDIRQLVAPELEAYTALFQSVLTHEDVFLDGALAHIRQRRGKMMRPLLVMLMAKDASPSGKVSEKTLRTAVTLELLHTASLIHDDVVDNSPERRGAPAEHTLYGNKVAILVGDYILSESLRQAAATGDIAVVDTIARLGGTLSEGEVHQLANIRSATYGEEEYFGIIRHKTAALFESCARLGMVSAGAAPERVEAAGRLGEIIGLCFQIRDDIFDYYADAAIGKPSAGGDMAEGKLTLPALYALRRAREEGHEAAQWAERVARREASREEIDALVAYAKAAGGIDYAKDTMLRLRAEAQPIIAQFHRPDIREALTAYLDYTIDRTI